jgi:hypothetical protein
MATPPESTKTSLRQRLNTHARTRWPALAEITVRHHGAFAYVAGELADGTVLPLCRLRYNGYANRWSFAIYLASKDGYEGLPARSCGLPRVTVGAVWQRADR